MILTCPSCSTRYFADGANLGQKGRAVRCAACSHTWHAREDDATIPSTDADVEEDDFDTELDGELGVVAPPVGAPKAAERPLVPGVPNVRASLVAWGAVGALALVVMTLAVVFRVEVVRLWPRTATAYAAAGFQVTAEGLVFENVLAEPGYADGEPTLTVTADVRNTSERDRPVPQVRISLMDDDGEEVFGWVVSLRVDELSPRQTARFTAVLAQPPADARDLELRFMRRVRTDAVPAETELMR